jgi:hypothetical protein
LVLSAQHLSNRAEAKRKGLVHLSASIDWRRVHEDLGITKPGLRSWIRARRTIEDVNRQIDLSGGRDQNAGGT